MEYSIFSHYNSGPRVLFWYRCFFLSNPILVLNAKEREPNEPYARISDAARTLASNYKLRVIVDGSDNTLPASLFATKRGEIISVEEMEKNILEAIPEFQPFIEKLRTQKLDEVVYQIVGGVPADYILLTRATRGLEGEEFQYAVDLFLRELQSKAINLLYEAKLSHPGVEKIYERFLKEEILIKNDISVQSIKRPSPDKTLRSVIKEGRLYLVPSTKAMAYILQNGCTEHTVAQIREFLAVRQNSTNLT
jgi:hypothetical protein